MIYDMLNKISLTYLRFRKQNRFFGKHILNIQLEFMKQNLNYMMLFIMLMLLNGLLVQWK